MKDLEIDSRRERYQTLVSEVASMDWSLPKGFPDFGGFIEEPCWEIVVRQQVECDDMWLPMRSRAMAAGVQIMRVAMSPGLTVQEVALLEEHIDSSMGWAGSRKASNFHAQQMECMREMEEQAGDLDGAPVCGGVNALHFRMYAVVILAMVHFCVVSGSAEHKEVLCACADARRGEAHPSP